MLLVDAASTDSTSNELVSACWRPYAERPALAAFPLLSVLVTLTGLVALVATINELLRPRSELGGRALLAVVVLSLTVPMVLRWFSAWCLAGLTDALERRRRGCPTRLASSARRAGRRLAGLAGWVALDAAVMTVGSVVLQALVSLMAGSLVGALAGLAFQLWWWALTFTVVPAMVISGLGPLRSLSYARDGIESNWRIGLRLLLRIALLSIAASVPTAALAIVAANSHGPTATIAVILAVISGLLVAGWFTATTDVARVALYRHGQRMDADAAFAGTALDGTPPPRRRRRTIVATGRLPPPVSTHPTSVDL